MIEIVKNERLIVCDIDDTLVMHGAEDAHWVSEHPDDWVFIEDPVHPGQKICLAKNKPMIRLVKEEMARGSQLVFWSRGGYEWATNVIQALGIVKEDVKVYIMTKPYAYFDDSDINHWLKDRVYIGPDKKYKE